MATTCSRVVAFGLTAAVTLVGLAASTPAGSDGGNSPLLAAEAAFEAKEFAAAYEHATEALRQDSKNARALFIAGAAGFEMERDGPPLKKIKKRLLRALEIAPDMPLAHYYLGAAFYTEARAIEAENRPLKGVAREVYLQAADHFEEELRVSADLVSAVAARASALLRAGDYERGEVAVEHWIDVSPRETAPYKALAGLLVDRDEIRGALELVTRVPDDAKEVAQDVAFRVALLLYRRDQERRAVELIARIRTADPGSWRSYGVETMAAFREERMDDAIEVFEAFLRAGPPESEQQAVADFFLKADERLLVKAALRLDPPASKDGSWKLVDRVRPVFPPAARDERVTGKAIVLAAVLEDGSVLVLRAMSAQSAALGFESMAGAAVRQWRYEPVTLGAEPEATVIRVTVDFDVR